MIPGCYMNKDYHDYVIKNGQYIGDFEGMYQNIDDPWHHGDASALHYDKAINMLNGLNPGSVLDMGCGKGAFTARLKARFPEAKVIGLDIAPNAIRKAMQAYDGIVFEVCDVRKRIRRMEFPVLTAMSDIMWYILPEFEHVVKKLEAGWLLINQTFYPPGAQKYGQEIVANVEGMIGMIPHKLIQIAASNQHTIVLFEVGGIISVAENRGYYEG